MSANQCRRWNVPDPQIPEPYPLCDIWGGADTRERKFYDSVTKCCTTPIKNYSCWYYCAVEESQFPTWLGCVREVVDSTAFGSCQNADRSPYVPPTLPSPPTTTTTTTSSTPSASSSVTPEFTSQFLPMIIRKKKGVKSGSPKALSLSMGGLTCAFLVLSAIAL